MTGSRWCYCTAAFLLCAVTSGLPWANDDFSLTNKANQTIELGDSVGGNSTELSEKYQANPDRAIGQYLSWLQDRGRHIILDEVDLFADRDSPKPLPFDASSYNDIILTYYDVKKKTAFQAHRTLEPMAPPWAENVDEDWGMPTTAPWTWSWFTRPASVQRALNLIQSSQKLRLPHITEAPDRIFISRYRLQALSWADTREKMFYWVTYRGTDEQAVLTSDGQFFVGKGPDPPEPDFPDGANTTEVFAKRAVSWNTDGADVNSSMPTNSTTSLDADENWNPDSVIQTFWTNLRQRQNVVLDEISLIRVPPWHPATTFTPSEFKTIFLTYYDLQSRQSHEARKHGPAPWESRVEPEWEEPGVEWQWQWRDRIIHIDRALSSLQEFQVEDMHYDEAPYKINIGRERHTEWVWADTRDQVYYEFFYHSKGFETPMVILTADRNFFVNPDVFRDAVRPPAGSNSTSVFARRVK